MTLFEEDDLFNKVKLICAK